MKSLIINSKKFGKVAVIYDDDDHEVVSKYNWYIVKLTNCLYAMSTTRNEKGKLLLMHRLILGVYDPKIFIDHINRCGIDNTKKNLRIATKSQNAANQSAPKTNTSGYKGVSTWHRPNGITYRARIVVDGNPISLGCFRNARDAALSYDKAAKQYFGEFARVNFT